MSEQKLVRFDWAMKYLLRNKANYNIVEGFLCALLNDNSIQVLEILESESNSDNENDKFNRVDVLVKDKTDRNIIIEIQNTRESDYLYRLLYGTSKNISQSLELGDKYRKINKVISVSILYFDLGIGEDYLYYGQTEFVGVNTDERINKDSEKVQKLIPKGAKYNQVEIFPEYYLIQVNKYKNIVKTAIDEWVYWFKNEKIKEGSSSKNIENVQKKLSILEMDKESRAKYEAYVGRMVSEEDMIETAKDDGIKEAEQKLIPIIEQNKKEIQEKNKVLEEKDKVIENLVKILKVSGKTNIEIQELTKLSIKEIQNIQ